MISKFSRQEGTQSYQDWPNSEIIETEYGKKRSK